MTPRIRHTVIEFLGHAGSGKTFLCRQLADSLGKECVSSEDFSMTFLDVWRFATGSPIQLFMSIRLVLHSQQRDLRSLSRSMRRILAYMVKLDAARRMNKRFILISEGGLKVLNDIRSTSANPSFVYEKLPARMRRSLFSSANMVVLVHVPVDVAATRLAVRQSPNASETDIASWRSRIEGNFLRSLTDNRTNIARARMDNEFKTLEICNDGRTPPIQIVETLRNVIDTPESSTSPN